MIMLSYPINLYEKLKRYTHTHTYIYIYIHISILKLYNKKNGNHSWLNIEIFLKNKNTVWPNSDVYSIQY